MICERFDPQIIIWDGEPNERGTREEYAGCIPEPLWKRVIPISTEVGSHAWAHGKGALPPIPKPKESLKAWAEQLTVKAREVMTPPKSGRK